MCKVTEIENKISDINRLVKRLSAKITEIKNNIADVFDLIKRQIVPQH